MNYLRNTWYVAAWDSEVKIQSLLSRKLLDEQIVLFRDSQGIVQALRDRCPTIFWIWLTSSIFIRERSEVPPSTVLSGSILALIRS